MREISSILDADEQVFWEGGPQFGPYIVSVIPFALFGLIFLVGGFFPFRQAFLTGEWVYLLIPHFWIGVLIALGAPLYAILSYKYHHYVITNKRVIIQSGLIGRDFKFVDFDQMTNAEVKVGLLDKLFGNNSGGIYIYSGGTFGAGGGRMARPYILQSITDPYTVFKFLKRTSHDVKTDINYPNKLRPTENPGYQSTYTPNPPTGNSSI